jgi:hypothetical protein
LPPVAQCAQHHDINVFHKRYFNGLQGAATRMLKFLNNQHAEP